MRSLHRLFLWRDAHKTIRCWVCHRPRNEGERVHRRFCPIALVAWFEWLTCRGTWKSCVFDIKYKRVLLCAVCRLETTYEYLYNNKSIHHRWLCPVRLARVKVI
jgi:hypothetical protein